MIQNEDFLQEWVDLINATKDKSERQLLAMLMDSGYLHPKKLLNGDYAVLYKFAFTWAILSGINDIGYEDRWCFHTYEDAKEALDAWDGEGDPGDKWHRHPSTGRRRDEKTGEIYVNW